MSAPRMISVESTIDDEDSNYKPSWADSGEDRTSSRRRSVECSTTRISIPQTEQNQDHTVYVIRVTTPLRAWTIKRRYRDFYYLDRELRKHHPNLRFPPLPPKRYLRSSSDPEIVDQRRDQLEKYLSLLIRLPQIWTRNDLVLFLNDESNIMTFIWNFERMRRLQDMLNSMKTTNQTETAKLTDDLAVARKQVNVLQARLSQMEMIFLQQATGMASQQLPNSVLRSLSGVDGNLSHQLRGELTEEHAVLYQEQTHESSDEDNADNSEQSADSLPMEEVVRAINLAAQPDRLASVSPKPEDARAYAVSLQLQDAIRLSNELLAQKVNIGLSSQTPEKSRRLPSYDYHPSRKSPIISAKFVCNAAESKFYGADLSESILDPSRTTVTEVSTNWIASMTNIADVIVDAITPSEEAIVSRYTIFKYVRDLVSTTLGCQLFPIGSLVSHTFLPESGIDCTAFVPKLADDGWFVKINEALCLSAFGPNDENHDEEKVSVSNVSFVNDEIKMIRSMINNVAVTVSTNQLNSIYTEVLIERLNAFVGRNNLFKRSILLLKAWFQFESARYTNGGGSLLGVKDGRLSSWALTVLMIYIFNAKGALITHPLQALGQFFAYYSSFDWCNLMMTVRGPAFRAEDKSLVYISDNIQPKNTEKFFPERIFNISNIAHGDYLDWQTVHETNDHVGEAGDATVTSSLSCSQDTLGQTAPSAVPSIDEHSASSTNGVSEEERKRNEVHPEYEFSRCNLIDPVDNTHNLLAPIEALGLEAFVSGLHEGYKHFQSVCDELSKTSTSLPSDVDQQSVLEKSNKIVRKLFANTCIKCGIENLTKMTQYIENKKGDSTPSCVFSVAVRDLQKGPMPVGEIGKNLQALLNCDNNLSRRLKEQFGGLKKAIERSSFTELKMGTEHPFNPVVTLLGESPLLSIDDEDLLLARGFGHAAYLFTPYSISLQLQAQAQKEAQLAQNKQNKQHNKAKFNNSGASNGHSNGGGNGSTANGNNASGSFSGVPEGMAQSPYGSYPPFIAMPMSYPGGPPPPPFMDPPSPGGEGGREGGSPGQEPNSPPGPGYYYPYGPPHMHMPPPHGGHPHHGGFNHGGGHRGHGGHHGPHSPRGHRGCGPRGPPPDHGPGGPGSYGPPMPGMPPMGMPHMGGGNGAMPMPMPPYPGIPVYPGPPMFAPPRHMYPGGGPQGGGRGPPPPPYYHMHNSLPGSLSSSYGAPPPFLTNMHSEASYPPPSESGSTQPI
eukprot:scaffold7965_cov159-Ochromonas_danica.AAC.2